MPWGAAIGAVGALGSAAINSSASKNSSSSSTSQSPGTQAATTQALNLGSSIANQQFTPYTGSVVQPLSAPQQQGVDQSQTGYAPAQADEAAAGSALTNLPQYNSSTLSQYMDPYVSSVLTPELNQENINYGAQASALNDSKAGAFGGDRSALAEGQLAYNHGQTIASDTANTYSAAYTNAQSAFFQDKNSQIQAASDLASVGNDVSNMNSSQIQNLMQAGGVEQALGQAQLNFNYQQFSENQDWDIRDLQPLLNSIDASKGVAQTTINTPATGSALGTALGAAATVAGAYFTGGASTNSTGSQAASNQYQQDLGTEVSNSQAATQSALQADTSSNDSALADTTTADSYYTGD